MTRLKKGDFIHFFGDKFDLNPEGKKWTILFVRNRNRMSIYEDLSDDRFNSAFHLTKEEVERMAEMLAGIIGAMAEKVKKEEYDAAGLIAFKIF